MDKDIRETFWNAMVKSPLVMIGRDAAQGLSEPMTAQLDKEALHAVWFFAAKGNRIADGGAATAHFSSKDHHVFASLAGTISLETDDAIREKHWSNTVESWFPDGRHDPNVLLLRFDISQAEVWTAEPGITGSLKMMTGSKIKPSEAGQHAVGNV